MVYPKKTDIMSWSEILAEIHTKSPKLRKAGFSKWFMSKKGLGEYFFKYNLYAVAYNIQKKLNEQDGDTFIVIGGKEGMGKSTLAIQLASVIDPTFNVKRICYKPLDLIRGIRDSKKGQAFILDEGNMFLFSREAMKGNNVMMVKLFALMRQKNLCPIICVPNFFTLDSYVREHRVEYLIHVNKRGSYRYFVEKAIKQICKDGKAFKNVQVQVPDGTFAQGNFIKAFPKTISHEEYKDYKGDTFDDFLDECEQNYVDMDKAKLVPISDAMKKVPMSRNTYKRLASKGEIKAKKIGQRWYIDTDELARVDAGGGGSILNNGLGGK